MITIHIPQSEIWDDGNNEFIYIEEQTIDMEHSLVSITKWEAKHHKVFLEENKKTPEEMMDYVRCMCINPLKNERDILGISKKDIEKITNYIEDPMIPFKLKSKDDGNTYGRKKNKDPMCGIMIYYYMVSCQIPFECQHWHINQLLALIQIYSMKENPGNPLKGSKLANRNTTLNAMRKARLGSKG